MQLKHTECMRFPSDPVVKICFHWPDSIPGLRTKITQSPLSSVANQSVDL